MTGQTVHIPTLETDRLLLRAPRLDDYAGFAGFYGTERAAHVGGPVTDIRHLSRAFGSLTGLWLLRGHSLFVAEEKAHPGVPIGTMGPYEPLIWPEMEFGWTLWDAAHEGKGYVTEAMRRLIPWTWERTGKDTAVSFIDAPNAASMRVAEALGAVPDPEMTARLNAPGGLFHDDDDEDDADGGTEDGGGESLPEVTVWRHQRATWEAAP